MSKFFIEIVEDATGKVENRMEAATEREADKIARGASINLNHAAYSVRIVPDRPEAWKIQARKIKAQYALSKEWLEYAERAELPEWACGTPLTPSERDQMNRTHSAVVAYGDKCWREYLDWEEGGEQNG